MPFMIETPQCGICLETLKSTLDLVRPVQCGHVYCKKCAEGMKRLNYCGHRCKLPSGTKAGLRSVHLSYGSHTIAELDLDKPSEGDGDSSTAGIYFVDELAPANDTGAQTTIRLLEELASTDAATVRDNWGSSSDPCGSSLNKGIVFARAGHLLSKIAEGLDDTFNSQKDLIIGLASAITNLQTLFDSFVKLVSVLAKGDSDTRIQLQIARLDLDALGRSLRGKEWEHSRLIDQHERRAEKRLEDIAKLGSRVKKQSDEIKSLKEAKRQLEHELNHAKAQNLKLRKKIETSKLPASQTADASDDSLDFEDDNSAVPTLSSSLPSTIASQDRPSKSRSQSKETYAHNPHAGSSKTVASQARLARAGTFAFGDEDAMDITDLTSSHPSSEDNQAPAATTSHSHLETTKPRPFSRTKSESSTSRRSHHHERETRPLPSARRAPDPALLAICPDLALSHVPETETGTGRREHPRSTQHATNSSRTRPKPASSAAASSTNAKPVSRGKAVPANPLAVNRASTLTAGKTGRKRPRLTLDERDVNVEEDR